MMTLFRALLLLFALAGADAAAAQTAGTRTVELMLRGGGSGAEQTFEAVRWQRIDITAASDSFDTVLMLVSPRGDTLRNDDYQASTDSRIVTVASEAGTWRATVTSYDDHRGPYTLEIKTGGIAAVTELPGRLTEADSLTPKLHRYRIHRLPVERPGELVVEMRSEAFSPQVVLLSPSGRRFASQEGFEGEPVTVTLAEAEPGEWQIIATHHESSDVKVGDYSVRVLQTPSESGATRRAGTLEPGDPRLLYGEFYDSFPLEVSGTREIEITLTSAEFDTFLAVRSPAGVWYNDDDGTEMGSRLILPAQSGTWEILATSFRDGETGAYELVVIQR